MKRTGTTGGRIEQGGFAYVLLLIAVALVGAVTAASLQTGASISRRAAESALLVVGSEFEAALQSYAQATPAGQARRPAELGDLLRDPRYPGVKRHLRRIWPDPLSGKSEWGLVRDRAGGIIGIHSLSDGIPIKRSGFPASRSHFEEASRYSEWVFGSGRMPVSRPPPFPHDLM